MTLDEAQRVLRLLNHAVPRYFARHPDGRVSGSMIYDVFYLKNVTTWADSNGWNSYIQVNPSQMLRKSVV